MKVKNDEIRSAADALRILKPMVPGIDLQNLVACNRVLFRVQKGGYDMERGEFIKGAVGINFKFDKEEIVDTDRAYTKTVDSIRFGIRVKDGELDFGKLAKKFNDNRERILEFLEHEARNDRERELRRDERYRKIDFTRSLIEEGLLDPVNDGVIENDDNYEFTIVLETDEEMRAAAEFYVELKKRREVTA